MSTIEIIRGDITTAQTDAIVNAANSVMLGGGGVDGAIHRAAGKALLEACYQIPAVKGIRCPVGEARITPAGHLKARYVIHTVGPVYSRDPNPAEKLASAYRQSLKLALDNHCRTVALPAISCGVYGYPHREAARIALQTCNEKEFSELTLSFYLFNDDMFDIWNSVYQDLNRMK